MLVELTNDDCHNGDDLQVLLWRAARATVKAMSSPTPAIAEREVWSNFVQGFELRQLCPIDPETAKRIEGPGHLAEGAVTFDALAAWGRTNGYDYRMTIPDYDKVNDYADARTLEIMLNGGAINWDYWRRMQTLKVELAARLMSGLDPLKFQNLNEKPGRGNPDDAFQKTMRILLLAEDQGMSKAAPAEWVQWAEKNGELVFPGFSLTVPEKGDSDAPAVAGDGAAEGNLTEIRIAAIVETAQRMNYDPMNISYGGKSAIEVECLERLNSAPHRFTADTFKKAWQSARDAGKIDVENAEIYRGGQAAKPHGC